MEQISFKYGGWAKRANYTLPDFAKSTDMALDNPHDKFFKASFSRKDVVAALIENRFPEPLRKRLDISTLELTNGSFVDDELNQHFADLVYECTYSGEQKVKNCAVD